MNGGDMGYDTYKMDSKPVQDTSYWSSHTSQAQEAACLARTRSTPQTMLHRPPPLVIETSPLETSNGPSDGTQSPWHSIFNDIKDFETPKGLSPPRICMGTTLFRILTLDTKAFGFSRRHLITTSTIPTVIGHNNNNNSHILWLIFQ
jgi:hypothetical protein